ncbi:MAG: hypothetical protein LBK64_05435 [Spirochaetaceae bacterium]|jgi:hypothetical protein|nr:hypothetical protein [Spirochaetaceae bacterium]
MSDNAPLSGPVKEWGIIAAWIGGILLLNTLLWLFTGSPREARFIQTVNRALAEAHDPRRIRKIQDEKKPAAFSGAFAHWYELEDGTGRAAVFSVLSGGVPASCLATLSGDGKVTEIIPLSGHSARVLETMPRALLGIYRRSLESKEQRDE